MSLPAIPVPDFHLVPGESIASGLRRMSMEQFEVALTGLSDSKVDRDGAIHEMRKSTKRVRALLRMVRPGIGEKVYRAENAVLRDAAARVSGVRDGAVMVDAVRRIRARYGHLLAPAVFHDVEQRLVDRHLRMAARVLDDEATIQHLVKVLYRARSRYAAWPVDPDDPRYGKKAIPAGFAAVGPGILSTYSRGRREMTRSYDRLTVESFHAWRKRVKYLRHQMEILAPVWPEVIGGLASSLAALGDVLGDEHDHAEMVRLVASVPDLVDDPDERNLLVALSQQRRRELQAAARVMGARIFAEPPDRFATRLRAYWTAWSFGVD
ncbi:MAG TPA: CHAD domain-containing protein [Acidimicrobiia bacterium]|jgi:CHAD domain-containing protein